MKRSQHGNISKGYKEAKMAQVGVERHRQTKRVIVGASKARASAKDATGHK